MDSSNGKTKGHLKIWIRIYKLSRSIRNRLFTILIRRSFCSFGEKSRISLPFRSGNEQAISLGNNVFIGSNSWVEVIGDIDPHKTPRIRIDDGVSISGDCTITAVSQVTIGKGALIARFVHISDHSHGTPQNGIPVQLRPISKIAGTHIGPGAWICNGVVVCPGVTIGRNAVIGANSVVCGDIPAECVAVGAPAKVVSFQRSHPNPAN